jgi:hypothetical protein
VAGYSGTPLAQKLGIKEGSTVAVVDEPKGFRVLLTGLPDDVTFRSQLRGRLDIVVTFFVERRRFEQRLPTVIRAMERDGCWWVCWPKKASRVPTDMTEDIVREVVLPVGLVDVKVAAIDHVWSGLKVMWRKSMR